MRTIVAAELTSAAFAPYGDVVSAGLRAGAAANQGTAVRFDRAATLTNLRPGATPNLAVFRSAPQPLPFVAKLLEHHPRSTQSFLPMLCARFLVCVAPTAADGGPDEARLQAFLCGPGQGITYGVGVWHHPIVALEAPAEFAMLAWEDGGPLDCVERPLVSPASILLP